MFASLWVAYLLWAFLGLFGAHRFYIGRPASGIVWLLTGGLFGIGWIIDFFLIPDFVEEHNKRVFHQQMVETGSSLLFDGEYGGGGHSAYDDGQQQYGVAPYATQNFHPQTGGYSPYNNGGGGNYGAPGRY